LNQDRLIGATRSRDGVADAARPKQHNVLSSLDEGQNIELVDQRFQGASGKREVVLFDGFNRRKAEGIGKLNAAALLPLAMSACGISVASRFAPSASPRGSTLLQAVPQSQSAGLISASSASPEKPSSQRSDTRQPLAQGQRCHQEKGEDHQGGIWQRVCRFHPS